MLIFSVEIDEKSSLSGGFQYNLMMINDSGLLFWPPCICLFFNSLHIFGFRDKVVWGTDDDNDDACWTVIRAIGATTTCLKKL